VSRRVKIASLLVMLLVGACAATASAQAHTPQPYAPDEFAPWLEDLWRAEAIFVGSFPFSLFLTLEVYDTYRFFTPQGNPPQTFNTTYAPWPFGSGAAAAYDPKTEVPWLLISAVSLSLVVSGIDFLIGRLREQAEHR
jgi:hypothetical protein